jgi:pyruvate/2-oxoglutarate dehydrogenase complex dihydrolipoamide dehydrogenase (E3) component
MFLKNKYDYDLVVIGAGSGGLTCAIGGAQIGAKVLLVEKDKIGGDCTHHGCVPSKALIHLSKDKNLNLSIDSVMGKVSDVVSEIYSHESVEKVSNYGVDVKLGVCKFISKNSVVVNNEIFTAKKIIVATGSRAKILDIKGLDKVKFMTNKEIFDVRKFKSITIYGCGPIGCEIGQALANLGIVVNLVNFTDSILAREDSFAQKLVLDNFTKNKNINFYLGEEIVEISDSSSGKKNIILKSGKSIVSDEFMLSVGRVPNIENLGLEDIGVKFDKLGIFVDDKLRSSVKNIFAVGDVARGLQFTHFANHQGKIALANTIFGVGYKYEKKVIPRVTFVNPEVASVGLSENELIDSKIEYLTLEKDFKNIDKAVADGSVGYYKIYTDKKGFILGACLVGDSSGELIGNICLCMKNKLKVSALADTIYPYPTYGYGLRNTCDQFRSFGFSTNKKKLVKFIFGLKGN